MDIKKYGWDEYFEKEWSKNSGKDMFPGRIIADYGQKLRVVAELGGQTRGQALCLALSAMHFQPYICLPLSLLKSA